MFDLLRGVAGFLFPDIVTFVCFPAGVVAGVTFRERGFGRPRAFCFLADEGGAIIRFSLPSPFSDA